jgi:hypothetical protein
LPTTSAFSARGIDFALITMTAITAVAAFEAVGSILVIAMFVCPAAAARMLTDSLARQIWLSAAIAVFSGIAGYLLAGVRADVVRLRLEPLRRRHDRRGRRPHPGLWPWCLRSRYGALATRRMA